GGGGAAEAVRRGGVVGAGGRAVSGAPGVRRAVPDSPGVGAAVRERLGVAPVVGEPSSVGSAEPDVSGGEENVGRGASVGGVGSVEGDGLGLGVAPSCESIAQTPTPALRWATATAPPTIHGARRGGRR